MLPWYWWLQDNEKASSSSRVYFNIASENGVFEMNAFTRLLAVLSVSTGDMKEVCECNII